MSSDGIATALQDSASALMEGGNNLEQAVALVAAANKVVQDPSSVGSALRTISLRLRGTSVEILEEMGEETDGVVSSVSKLQEKIKALSGVDILTDAGDYKDTYTILKEIGQVWEDMSDIDQAALLELMAGKNRANTLSAILGNMSDLEGAYNDALKAEGSALKENEAYLDSIQGRIDLFTNSLQTMWMNFVDSDVVKDIVDLGTALLKAVDNAGLLKTALIVIGGIWSRKNFGNSLFISPKQIKTTQQNLANLKKIAEEAEAAYNVDPSPENYENWNKSKANLEAYSKVAQDAKINVDDLGASGEVAGSRIKNGFNNAVTSVKNFSVKAIAAIKSFSQQVVQLAKSMALMYAISTAIEGVTDLIGLISRRIKGSYETLEELQSKYDDISNELSNCTEELESLEAELDTTNDRIEELMAQGSLSFVEQEELERLQAVSAELERQISMQQTLQSSLQKGTNDAAILAGNAYLNTSFDSEKSKTERQEEAEEVGKSWGKYLGLALGAAAGVAITFATAGAAAPAAGAIMTGLGVGAGIGSAGGEAIGGWIGASAEGDKYDKEQTVEQAIASMNETRAKLIKARDDAYKAYASNPMNTDIQKEYQDAAEALAIYDETMARHIDEMSQYYNTISSNWEKASDDQKEQAKYYGDILDKYNIEMGGVNAKENAINRIFGTEASDELLKVKSALEEMAKEGEKIDLEKAFGNTAAYDAFVDRLYDMGIYVYECEDAFYQMQKAAAEAAGVDFTGIATDINGIVDAITGIRNAYDEFLEQGYVTSGTILDLKEYFQGTEDLQDLYDEYVGIMMSGNASIADARAITAKLAQAYIEENVHGDAFDPKEMSIYVTQLKELGIANAEQLMHDAVQNAGLDKIQSEFDKAFSDVADSFNSMHSVYDSAEDLALSKVDIEGIADAYNLEADAVDNLIAKLKEKKKLEVQEAQQQKAIDDYNSFMNGDEGYRALKEEYNKIQVDLKALADLEAKIEEGSHIVSDVVAGQWVGYYNTQTGEKYDIETGGQLLDFYLNAEEYRKALGELDHDMLAAYYKALEEGQYAGYLDANGNIVDTFKDQLEDDLAETQNAINGIGSEIEAEFTIDYSLIFNEPQAVNTISGITEAIAEYKNSLDILNDGLYDGQSISEEYYNSLREQLLYVTVGTQDFFDAVDTSNGYIVKNSDLLKKLTEQSKKSQRANIKLAKSHARIEYYDLYKQMRKVVSETDVMDDATRDHINSLYDQMRAVQKTIAKYSLLEAELLGAANAYSQLEDALAADEAADYGSKAEELVNIMGEAFNTGKLGTEAARVAIEGLIPDDVIDKSKTLDEQMEQIYGYFTKGKISQLFTIEFDDEGAIQSVEMTKENVEAFTNSLIDAEDPSAIFQGTWDEFTLNPAIKTLEDFAKQAGVTKDVAFAYLTELEKYDIGNALGNGESILDHLMGDNLEYQLHEVIQAAAEAEKKLANGVLSANDEEYINAQNNLEMLEEQAIADTVLWQTKQANLDREQANLKKYAAEYQKAMDEGRVSDADTWKSRMEIAGSAIDKIVREMSTLEEPTELVLNVAAQEAQENIDNFKKDNENNDILMNVVAEVDEAGLDGLEQYGFEKGVSGDWVAGANVTINGWEDLSTTERDQILSYINMIDDQHVIDILLGEGTKSVEETLEDVAATLQTIADMLEVAYDLKLNSEGAYEKANSFKTLWDGIKDKTVTVTTFLKDVFTRTPKNDDDAVSVNGNAHFNGSAYAGGTIGAKKTETSLMGELGPEILVRNGRWTTVGENGAEFKQVKKGDIIFNHKQSEQLLKHGYVTGRGKAYASGVFDQKMHLFEKHSGIDTWDEKVNLVYNDYSNTTVNTKPSGDLSSDYGNQGDGDGKDKFEETIDWIEILMEEFAERLDKLNAELELQTNYIAQNNKIDEMIAENRDKYQQSLAGADRYEQEAAKYWAQIPAQYKEWAKNGAIDITDFVDEDDEATVEAIEKYRDYAQKAADLDRQALECLAEIRDLAIQRVDNAYEAGSVRATVEASQTEKLQNAVDFDEAKGLIADAGYYVAMMENSSKTIEYLTRASSAMQEEFDTAIKNGELIVGSNEYYETLDKLYQVQSEIDQARIELEEFQNAINEIYWANFEQVINRFEYLSEETNGLIDLMSELDMVSKPDNEDGWSADDVEWTAEGLATLGLHAQEMERAEARAQMYAQAIDDLTAEYEAGHYSESEYYEKLNELTQGQYDAIEAAQDEKEAIIELNEARVDAIKEGIEKQIDAYEELIEKQKESLEAAKDAHDFEKSIEDSTKNITDIERKLAALEGDHSASARAQRAKLEAELAEARADLEEQYYDRSIENQQDALDRELENFTAQKEEEIEQWNKYLEDIEVVLAESLGIVQENAAAIGATLTEKAEEYNLTISNAVLNPWTDGVNAISDYTTRFGDFASSTTQQLEAIRVKWEEIKNAIAEANLAADEYYDGNNSEHTHTPTTEEIHNQNQGYVQAQNPGTSGNSGASTQEPAKPATPNVGSSVTVKTTATHFSGKSGGAKMASFVPGGAYTVYQTAGNEILIGRNGVYTGWVNKHDLVGYAHGTTGVDKDQWALIDELGDELVMHASGGKLAFLTKGSAVIPHDISENLMQLGSMNPQDMLDRNRPIISAPHIVNNEININMNIAEVVHIDEVTNDTIPDLTRAVRKEMDSYMTKLNNAIRSKVR